MKNRFLVAAVAALVTFSTAQVAAQGSSGGSSSSSGSSTGASNGNSANTTDGGKTGSTQNMPGRSLGGSHGGSWGGSSTHPYPSSGTGMNQNTPGATTRRGQTTDGGANMVTDINGNQAANRTAQPVTAVLPAGTGTYTYYADANTYYNPRTKIWYYQQSGEWRAATTRPKGMTMGKGQTVRLQGQSNVNGAGE